MSKKDNINYDPDDVGGDDGSGFDDGGFDDGGFDDGGFDDGGDFGDLVQGDDSDGELIAGDDGDDSGGGFVETPEEKIYGLWADSKELKGEERLKALEDLLEQEKNSCSSKTNEGFKAVKHIIIISVQLGKFEKVQFWFQKWVDEYKTQMKQHLKALPKTFAKIGDYPDLPALVPLAFQNISATDKLNRTKILLLKASSLIKRNDPALTTEIVKTLDEVHAALKTSDGQDDTENHANLLLDLYAQKIILADRKRNYKDLKSIFEKADVLTTKAMGNNAVLGTIYSVGGRSKMRERRFADATKNLVEAVKNWDLCRNKQETEDCIKLMVVSSLLSNSKVNPFDDQVVKSHLNTPAIKAFERITRDILTKNADSFLVNIKPLQREEIVKDYLPMLKRLIQKDLFLEVVKPYTNISMNYIGKRIHTTPEETESIVVELILNQQIQGTIDQATGILVLDTTSKSYTDYYTALHNLANTVDRIQRNVLTSVS